MRGVRAQSVRSLPKHGTPRSNGEMAERLKAHAWKACIRQRIGGSNPSLSAKFRKYFFFFQFLTFLIPDFLIKPISFLKSGFATGDRATTGREPRQARKGATVALFAVCPVLGRESDH